ncbi:ADP-ribose pyrophosphatase [Lihuaxuella thermophila]|uniref:ADP-ribose pyrophosphatase n=1 Tax=Lihuaxuella thermophila TaxID=1173111 RepID=A0A1H8ER08_9BACL|nr:NUDIX hydrolase [Lihuaxuella thermophila]SEN21208.1 ADP-ribose pyrophosphatase [Lihuaxuella thermophila]
MIRLEEKTIKSETIFEGRVVRLQIDQVELPNGETSTREIVKHPGAVSVMAVTNENKLVLVRQFRKPLEKTILEIPAGKLESGEDPIDCAFRELEEETGYRAAEMQHVYSFYTSPGFADEYLHLYLAKGLTKGKNQPDQDEFVELVELTLEECLDKIAEGDICDAKTVAAVLLWQNRTLRGRSG